MKKEDFEIVRKIKNGDERAERELFERFNTKIIRKVIATIGNSDDRWKDLVSEIHVAILVSLRDGKYDPEKGVPLGSYVYGIVLNKLKDFFKKDKRSRRIVYETIPDSIERATEDYELEMSEMRKELRKQLKALKPKYKQVLYLRYFKQLSISEISEQINIPKRRVSERINYALKLLKKNWKNINFFSIFPLIMLINI